MNKRRKNRDSQSQEPASKEKDIVVSSTAKEDKLSRRPFPGPPGAKAPLRIAATRASYADLVAHAKSSLEAEVCGVLVGEFNEDDDGPFANVEAIIQGSAAAEGATHVTFTQETWEAIHARMDREFPDRKIVGWYHTHPGFGVEFSEMDIFIQKNFFSGRLQFALVTDPVNGDVAICINHEENIRYLPRFWIDGREQQCRMPKESKTAAESSSASGGASDEVLKSMEARISQLIQVMDEHRAANHRFVVFVGMLVCVAIIMGVGYNIYSAIRYRNKPPETNTSFIPAPIQLGDKKIMVGLTAVHWEIPEELDAALKEKIRLELELKEAKEKARKELEEKEKKEKKKE